MLQKFLHIFVRRRHYWRNVGFDELSELYASMMFRSLATSLVAIFIPIYLFQLGHEVWAILFFYAILFMSQLFFTPVAAVLIARYGPRHTMLLSYLVQSSSLIMLTQLSHHNIPLEIIATTMGAQLALFFTAFNVNFSKIKHSSHGGKEVSWAYTMQKLGTVLGPVIGGAVAYFFGSEYIFYVALSLFVVASVPLMLSQEPTKLRQKLDISHLPFRSIKYDLISFGALSVEDTVSRTVWPLFVGVVVFTENPYIQLGGVASLSVIVSLVVARMIGVLADKKKGRALLRYSAVFNVLIHLYRPFANGFSSVLAVNAANEATTLGYELPYMKGVFDAADEHPGFRIVYISILKGFGAFCTVIFYLIAGVLASIYGPTQALFFVLFALGGIASLGITTERFRALKP